MGRREYIWSENFIPFAVRIFHFLREYIHYYLRVARIIIM